MAAQQQIQWHTISGADALAHLRRSVTGLTASEVRRRLDEFGPNRLPRPPAPSFTLIFLRQFQSPLIYILAFAVIVSAAIGDYKDAAFIGGVLILNALIGAVQEIKAEESSRALQKLLRTRATVSREGEVVDIDAEEVVPGDIVWLESGARAPADLRLLGDSAPDIDESLLTGESLAVHKRPAQILSERAVLADRVNMAYAGSMVARGRGKGVVVATGSATEVGRLALDVMATTGGQPPLVLRMASFSRMIALFGLFAALTIGVTGVLIQGYSIAQMFLFGVALAVSIIPEGLPVAMTITLSVASTRMAQRGVIVRRLAAVEGLGSCSLIASDKTGTLTCNELTVRAVITADGRRFAITGEGYAPIGEAIADDGAPASDDPALRQIAFAAALCNEADLRQRNGLWVWRGDPTDVAMLALAGKLGVRRETALDRRPEITSLPFEPERRYAASFHRVDGAQRVYVKGAPERVLRMCAVTDTAERLAQWTTLAEELAAAGYRALALAEGPAPEELDPSAAPPEPHDLTLLGFVAMIDPLRPGAREAVQTSRRAGVEVVMVTGDHPVTALAIANELGLAQHKDQVMTGAEIEALSDAQLADKLRDTRVFARVTPREKLTLVNAARAAGHLVAVTGDGANDAPALRAANIGVAMGKAGTDVAREAAELVISDDNFATIVAGIEAGRIAYGNLRKVIYFLVSSNAAEALLIGLALGFGYPLPLLPVQLLWLNLVTEGFQHVALAFEPGEGDELARPPRPPRERIFNTQMVERTAFTAIVMALCGFGLFHWLLSHGYSEGAARNALLLYMTIFENFHVGSCRSETTAALTMSPLRNPYLLAGVTVALGAHIAMMYSPWGQSLLSLEPVSVELWGVIAGLGLVVFSAVELHKTLWRRRERRRG
ncbi:MAG TPA: HAD-IC family P-type ATPase [candidate division Zixibacteria bacterium]|nr:HAD-IC family P-type ATPase [candidate division Zixibacteria bacterium]